ncbi:uncharacterized protein YALI1_C24198g [Yarrowia lipolytica]|uniref:Uncharacterized protein n=1 Tax=Yarrowia lipolytica TaxID=4952 RepID=A0A1D8NBI6_YARLL|nr:hypothetical protein YALI1_C24198g [Yarrowia lipolytica]
MVITRKLASVKKRQCWIRSKLEKRLHRVEKKRWPTYPRAPNRALKFECQKQASSPVTADRERNRTETCTLIHLVPDYRKIKVNRPYLSANTWTHSTHVDIGFCKRCRESIYTCSGSG